MNPMAQRSVNLGKFAIVMGWFVASPSPQLIGQQVAPTEVIHQSTASLVPAFEVASIKRCGAGEPATKAGARSTGPQSPDRLSLPCQPMKNLIRMAYIVFSGDDRNPPSVIEGGPGWTGSEVFRVNAKAEGTPGQDIMRGPMLRRLLEDRFQLKVHRETRQVPAYLLTVAKSAPHLQSLEEGSCFVVNPSNRLSYTNANGKPLCNFRMLKLKPGSPNQVWELHGATLDDFARALGRDLDRIVINLTGLAGKYDFHLEFVSSFTKLSLSPLGIPPDSPSDPEGISIFRAIQQELGLKLESGRGASEFLIIDHVDRPTEN
jgi:uncharacterized protein (TIGR03435 family)